MMACEHGDCFTCPYPDCISKKGPEKRKPGRKKMNPEIVKQHRLEYQRRYNQEHKEKINEFMRNYYYKHKEEYRAREKRNRQKKKGVKMDKEWEVEATIEVKTSFFCDTKEEAERMANEYLTELCTGLYPDCCSNSYEIENIYSYTED